MAYAPPERPGDKPGGTVPCETDSPMKQAPGAWRREPHAPSLPEAHRSVAVPSRLGFFRKLLAFSGPGYMVAVGYMDPGNWATDLAGGSRFGYTLLSVILLSNLMAVLLQHLCVRLGVATGRDLAQACRDHFSPRASFTLWLLCEVAIAACDLAEVIGSAIALQLLFGLPLPLGVCLTALDVLLLLVLQRFAFRSLEAIVIALIVSIAVCFGVELWLARPDAAGVLRGFVPSPEIIRNPGMLYVAIGILGATVMPHNLYLHSAIVQTRAHSLDARARHEAIRFATLDSSIALTGALFINGAILILSAAAFHARGMNNVAEIQDAYKLLAPTLGASTASVLFAVALLASGQNSTITGTLAGQIVMEGFLHLRLRPWVRRLVTRAIAIIPAVVVSIVAGERGTNSLLVLSQVILSMQLPFAVIPLIMFVADRRKMGEFRPSGWVLALSWGVAAVIVALNAKLLYDTVSELWNH